MAPGVILKEVVNASGMHTRPREEGQIGGNEGDEPEFTGTGSGTGTNGNS